MSAESAFLSFFLLVIAYTILSWLLMGLVLHVLPKATLRLALANILIGIGVYLSAGRYTTTNWVVWNLADVLGLVGIMYYRASLNFMVKGSLKRLEPTVAAFVVASLYLFIPPGYEQVRWFSLLFSLTIGYIFLMMIHDIHQWHRQDRLTHSVWLFSWPFWAILVLFSVSILRDFRSWSADYEPVPMVEQGVWWFYICFVLIINGYMTFIGVFKLIGRIRYYSEHDSLTRVLNHRHFKKQLVLRATHPKSSCLSVIYFDLDNFKKINDTYGHAVGDKALVHAISIIRMHVRELDSVGRMGGEEFAILLAECDEALASTIAERMREALEKNPLIINNESIVVTASFGAASAPSSLDPHHLLDTADLASYEAKSQGKNRVVSTDLGCH